MSFLSQRFDHYELALHCAKVIQLAQHLDICQEHSSVDAGASAASRGDDELVDQVLTQLLRMLPPPAEVEMDPHMGAARRVQQLQAAMAGQHIGTVGLYGMGGIDKTTLAKAFFAEQCKCRMSAAHPAARWSGCHSHRPAKQVRPLVSGWMTARVHKPWETTPAVRCTVWFTSCAEVGWLRSTCGMVVQQAA